MRKFGPLVAAIVALGLAGTANAVPITGSISFSDGGITVPPVPSTSIVSQLNTITQGPPVANSCTGSFTCAAGSTAGTINLLAPAGTIYTNGGFTFTLATVAAITRDPLSFSGPAGLLGVDSLSFAFAGMVDDGPGGLDPTTYAGVWTGNGACLGAAPSCQSNVTASYSASIVATGAPSVPEPASLALLGTALVGLGFATARRRRSQRAA